MPPIPKETVEKARELYLQGKTGDEVCQLTGMKKTTFEKMSARLKWRDQRNTLKQMPSVIQSSVKEGISKAVAETASSLAREEINRHLSLVKDTTLSVMEKLRENLTKELHLPAILEHQSAETAVRTLARLDDMRRRAMGLPDSVQAVDVTSGGMPAHESAMAILASCKKLVQDGQAKAETIDVEGLRLAMQSEAEGK